MRRGRSKNSSKTAPQTAPSDSPPGTTTTKDQRSSSSEMAGETTTDQRSSSSEMAGETTTDQRSSSSDMAGETTTDQRESLCEFSRRPFKETGESQVADSTERDREGRFGEMAKKRKLEAEERKSQEEIQSNTENFPSFAMTSSQPKDNTKKKNPKSSKTKLPHQDPLHLLSISFIQHFRKTKNFSNISS